MNVDERGWALVPDFSTQLQAAMDYAGLDARQVADGLAALGIGQEGGGPQHVHRLLKGQRGKDGERKRANPTFVMIAGLAKVCHVPVAWFFDSRTNLPAMVERYYDSAESD